MASARRSGRVAISPCSRTSAWRSTTSRPASPLTVMRSHPTRFCPKSRTVAPLGVVSTSRTGTSSVRRAAGVARASGTTVVSSTRTAAHPESSNPGADQPGSARRASNDSPA
ncbi:hypothetical protein BJF90_44935 [Pseudonocardia sp. CNS-004]|nr:hypothetical protein BJF90_44935 [Pseudonocardia sp. CNS-004]